MHNIKLTSTLVTYLRCLDTCNCEIKQNTACRTNELHIVHTHKTCFFSLGTILAIRSFVCQFDELVGGGEHGRADRGVLNSFASATRKSVVCI